MSCSPFQRLLLSARPINKQAAVIGFWRGEHFDLKEEGRLNGKNWTMDTPPPMPERPENTTDYTGKRSGRMTALFWYRRSSSGKGAVWIARCDCGRYEKRRPKNWGMPDGSENPNDMCGVCLTTGLVIKGGSSHEKMPERLMAWAKKLQKLGLTDAEISFIRIHEIHTKDMSAEQIRTEIAKAKHA